MYTAKLGIRAPFLGIQATNPRPAAHSAKRSYTSGELFGEQTEIAIQHAGQRYQLRITSLGKLILTK